MAGGKVREWIRKRAMPRKASAAGRRSSASGASTPILREAAGSGASGATAAPARSKVRAVSALPTALRWRPRVNVLAALYEKVVYHLLWLVESVVMVSRLCFFLMRFGFKQL